MEIFGYLASVLTGVSLGMIGGGGSILTVPILVYLFAVDPQNATAYSLFIVGITSLTGILSLYKTGFVNLKIALLFGLSSSVAVVFARKVILPAIPPELLLADNMIISRSLLIMLFFATVMIAAALLMVFRKDKPFENNQNDSPANQNLIVAEAILVGTISGISGAGEVS